jgi:hypothetical protein
MGGSGEVLHSMSNSAKKIKSAIGFYSVVRHAQHGLFGGYLLLNRLGRPLEFHCTTPVKPNRAQEILYGPTLDAFYYGEQIGLTLLKQSCIEPLFVCTDQEPALWLRDHTELPVALVLPPSDNMNATPQEESGPDQKKYRLDPAHRAGMNASRPLATFDLGRNRLALPAGAENDRAKIVERIGDIAMDFDLAEPFSRIHDALAEAQQGMTEREEG